MPMFFSLVRKMPSAIVAEHLPVQITNGLAE
jgi:hypothetical protein